MTDKRLVALAVAAATLAGAAQQACAADPPAPSIGDYYPAAAKAAGIGGTVTMQCHYSVDGALADCGVASEAPPNQGFGPAALVIAAHTPGSTTKPLMTGITEQLITVTLIFSPSPVTITPDILHPPLIVALPPWLGFFPPSRAHFYPEDTDHISRSGEALVGCLISNGVPAQCKVEAETPTGYGFGKAALQFDSYLELRPHMKRDLSMDGDKILIPMRFQQPGQ